MKKVYWVIFRKEDGDMSHTLYDTREKARNDLAGTVKELVSAWTPISRQTPRQLKKMFVKLMEGYSVKKAILTIK